MTLTAETVDVSDSDDARCAEKPTRRNGWYVLDADGQTTLSRHLPARFDVSAMTVLAPSHPVRLAHQIRQDLWRALQNVRGFSPVVQVTQAEGGVRVKAGGRLAGRTHQKMVAQIEAVLEDPDNRARWMRCAREREGAK